MTEKERVTVDFDSESYLLDGRYWTSFDNFGEEMADKINELLNKQDEEIKSLKLENKLLLEEMKQIRDKLTIYLEIKEVGDLNAEE